MDCNQISLAPSAVDDMLSNQQSATIANLVMSSDTVQYRPWSQTHQVISVPDVNYQNAQWPQQGNWQPSNTNTNMRTYFQTPTEESTANQYQCQRSFPSFASNLNQLQMPQSQDFLQTMPYTAIKQFVPALNHTTPSRIHQARISLVPNAKGGFKAVVKRKRKRTMFTTEQVELLESVFKKKPYISREDRQVLVNQLQINDTSIKVWFQNRRLKGKREAEEAAMMKQEYEDCPNEESFYGEDNSASVSSEQSSNSSFTFERINRIESELNNKADESGYVTLDDKAITEIASIIDAVLAPNIVLNLDNPSQNNKVEDVIENEESTYSGSIYEPISPATSERSEEEAPKWQPFPPDQSLKQLFDLHFC